MHLRKFTICATLATFLTGLVFLGHPRLSEAGCGCDKPPPAPASVQPNATYGGMPVTLFSSSFQTGMSYNVTFISMNGQSVTTTTQPTSRRDQSDGVYKKTASCHCP